MNRFIISCFTIFALISFIFCNSAGAEDDYKITGHYYVATDQKMEKYTEKIKWDISNTNAWGKFLNDVQALPQEKNDIHPLKQGQPDIIHISQQNADQISGNDVFLSKAGIYQFNNSPNDAFYPANMQLNDLLDTSLLQRKDNLFDENIPSFQGDGIVVIYKQSTQLKNPTCFIASTDKTQFPIYKEIFSNLQKTKPDILPETRQSDFGGTDNFIIYPSYPDAPFKVIVVAKDGNIRATNVQKNYKFFKDTVGYYYVFKRQAEDSLKSSQIEEKHKSPLQDMKKALEKNQDKF